EQRNTVTDRARMGTRIEEYRTREARANPELILQARQSEVVPAGAIPEINASELDHNVLRDAIQRHGALIVRGMFSETTMATLTRAADHVIDACEDPEADKTAERGHYFNPPDNLRSIMPNKDRELGNTRNFHRTSGSAMCVEAPSVAESLLELYEQYGLKDLVTDYLGEAPCLSVKKWVLRRSLLPVAEAGWHQDGAFMGTDINTINMWIPLNACGGTTGAPGMDVVPRRLYGLASAEGAQFEWSVSDSHVQGDGNEPVAPEFGAGDAFFFDHLFLHRTQYRADFINTRYAIETWFFGATTFPKNQIPLAW
ncbi:MAG: hypothetical protein HKN19_20140, partial [Halioglobus sp.]|nr:hypothetical protein [Halioglobus sp.]